MYMYQGLGQMLTKCLQHHQGCPETPKSADVICERPLTWNQKNICSIMTGTPGDGGAAVGGGVAPGDQLRGGQREVGGHPAPAAATASSLHRQSKVSRAATNHQRSFHIRGDGPY